MRIIVMRHAKADHKGLTDLGIRQTEEFRQMLIEEELLHEQPVVFCSPEERAVQTAKMLIGERTGALSIEEWLVPDGMKWFDADQETQIIDKDKLARAVLADPSQHTGPKAQKLRAELEMFRSLIRMKAVTVQMPEDTPPIFVTHMEFMLGLGPILDFAGTPVIRECEGYLLELGDDRKSARVLEFLQAA